MFFWAKLSTHKSGLMVRKEEQRVTQGLTRGYPGAEHFPECWREGRDRTELEAVFRQLYAVPKDVPIHKHI